MEERWRRGGTSHNMASRADRESEEKRGEGGRVEGESRGRVPRKGAGTAEKTGRACSKEKG